MNVKFDHIEAHVDDIQSYCNFLAKLFEGGTSVVISTSGTSMFTSPEGINIEVKKRKLSAPPANSGFCNPCLRRSGAKSFIEGLGLVITSETQTPDGPVYFFTDREQIPWHIKERAR